MSKGHGLEDRFRPAANPLPLSRELLVSVFATSFSSMPAFLLGELAVQIRQSFPMSSAELGIGVTAYYLGAAIWAVPSGTVAEHFGGVRVLKITPVAGAILLASIAMFANSWWLMTLLMFPCGIVSVATGTASNLFLARRTALSHQGAIFGLKQAAIPIASVLGGLAVPAIALTIGWRWAYILAALVSIWIAIFAPQPRSTLRERRRRATGDIPRIQRLPLALLAAGIGLGILAASGMAAFMVSAAVAEGLTKAQAGLVAALAGLSAAVIRIASGVMADRRHGRHFEVIAIMMFIGSLGYGVLALGQASRIPLVFIVGSVISLGVGWGWNGLFNFAVIESHRATPARATGMTQVGGRIGGMLGPILIGVAVASSGYEFGWLIAAASCLLASVAVLLGKRLLAASTDQDLIG